MDMDMDIEFITPVSCHVTVVVYTRYCCRAITLLARYCCRRNFLSSGISLKRVH